MAHLDGMDLKILNYLIEYRKLDAKSMAEKFKTTQKTIYDRIARLKSRKVIEGVFPKLDSRECGYVLEAIVMVKLIDSRKVKEFVKEHEISNVTSSFIIAGIYDVQFIVKFRNPNALSSFLDRLRENDLVEFADLFYIEETRREGLVPFPLEASGRPSSSPKRK